MKAVRRCKLKTYQRKMPFQVYVNTILWQGCIKTGHLTQSTKGENSHRNASTQKQKKGLQAFLGIINYLNKFSPSTSEACEQLRKLTSSKATWTWNTPYQQLFDKAKSLIKVEMCMKFYDDTKLLYLKTDGSDVGLGAALLQLRNNMNCPKDTAPDNTILCPICK